MGIINLTPDSFSDGGKYNKNNFAKKHVNNLQQIAFFQYYIIAAKMLVINKLNSVKSS